MRMSKDSGNIALLTVIVLTALLGFGALCTDMALLYAEKSKLQNAVDAAALAGAQELPYDSALAIDKALQYALNNSITLSNAQVSANKSELSLTTQKDVRLHLARIIGIESKIVKASAKAVALPANKIVGAVPLSITEQDFIYGQDYTLKSAPPEGINGWYGPLRLEGQGASDYTEALTFGSEVPLRIGQIVEVEHGNMSGPTNEGLERRLNSDTRIPRNTYENFDRDAPQIIYIPVVQVMSISGSSIQTVKIVGFAAFFVESVNGSGNDCFITGKFIKTLVTGGREVSSLSDLVQSDDLADDNNDYGLLTTKLMN